MRWLALLVVVACATTPKPPQQRATASMIGAPALSDAPPPRIEQLFTAPSATDAANSCRRDADCLAGTLGWCASVHDRSLCIYPVCASTLCRAEALSRVDAVPAF
jgi:hypothetical protein